MMSAFSPGSTRQTQLEIPTNAKPPRVSSWLILLAINIFQFRFIEKAQTQLRHQLKIIRYNITRTSFKELICYIILIKRKIIAIINLIGVSALFYFNLSENSLIAEVQHCTFYLLILKLFNHTYYLLLIAGMWLQPKPEQTSKLGCYGKITESSEPKAVDFELPLRQLAYDLQLFDSIAALTTTQIYCNNSDKTLDVQYIFPVNPKAAIQDFQVSFTGHFIKGVIKSKEDAERQYKENVKAGRAAVYGDTSYISKDLMRLKIGNVAPNQEITIKMKIVSEVLISYNTFYEFRLATAITPRYALNLDRRDMIFSRNGDGRSMEGKCSWSLKIVVKSLRKLVKFFSKTHQINPNAKTKNEKGIIESEIEVTEPNMMPNKDFSLCYTFEKFQQPSAWLSNSDFNTSAMVSFIPKFCQLSLNDAEYHAKKGKQYPVDLDKAKGEYIFLLDRSGSMGGSRIQKAKQSLIFFLKSLPEDCYFNVLSFGSHYKLLFPRSAKYQSDSIKQAIEQVNKMKANMGGTEILQAIQQIMRLPLNQGYIRQLFLLTDGSVDNTNKVIRYVSQNTKFSRVNCIGIGNGCSEALIDGCAQMGKGYKTYISDDEEPSTKIIELLEKSLSPVITKIELNFDDKSQVESIVPNPQKLPYILKNDLANFYITFQGKLTKRIKLNLRYTDTDNKIWSTNLFLDPSSKADCPYVTAMTSFKRVNALNNILKSQAPQEDHIYYVKQIDMKQLEKEVIRESIKRQILTDLTAFICIDNQTPDNVGQEAKERLKEKVYVQPMNPQGHALLVEAYEEESSYSQDYEDQCCVQTFEMPPEQNLVKKIQNGKNITKSKTRKIPFLAADGSFKNAKIIEGVKLIQSQKRKTIKEMSLIQDPDGKWTESSEIIYKIHNADEYERLKKKIVQRANIKDPYIITFLIIKWLVNRSKQDQAVYSMILKKANNYIAKSGFSQILEEVYRTQFNSE